MGPVGCRLGLEGREEKRSQKIMAMLCSWDRDPILHGSFLMTPKP
jgi:hypothetical protein